MKRKVLLWGAISLAVLTLLAACGRSPDDRWDRRSDYVVRRLDRELNLTQEQRVEVEALVAEVTAEMASRRESSEPQFDEAQALFRQDRLSAEEVEAFIEAYEGDRQQTRRFMAQKVAEFHAILTPEQRDRLAQLAEEHHTKHHRRR